MKRRREMRKRGPTLGEIAVDGDPVEFAERAMDEGETRSQSEMTVAALNVQGQEPRYLREASRMKPLPKAQGGGSALMGAMWFPAERPNARTTTDGDLPLHFRPYEVRRTASYGGDDGYYFQNDSDQQHDTTMGYARDHMDVTERSLGHAYFSGNGDAELERAML